MKHLYYIRHGESELNAQGLLSGHTDTPLTVTGIAQAEAAGSEARDLHIDHIISSPLSRAHDTARYVAEAIGYPEADIEINDLLIERNFGSAERTPWSPNLNIEVVVDAEPLTDLRASVQLFWKYVQTIPADTILIVSHGSTGRMLRTIIHPDIPFAGGPGHHFPNAQVVQLV